jgi:fucose permease
MLNQAERWVARCSYLGMFVQALVINLTPLLFIPLREQFDLSFEQVGRLILINFFTQLTVDLVCIGVVDRVAVKPLIVLGNFLAALGLGVFAWAAWWENPYSGLVLGTAIFSAGCGLLEVLLSPIINALPSRAKSASMALLHAFYPIGKLAVILGTGLVFVIFGTSVWPWVVLGWMVLPVVNTLGFALVPVPRLADPVHRERVRGLVRLPVFGLLLVGMFLAGATEVTLAQWASAFLERGIGLSKGLADLGGFALFAVGMIIGRLWFGMREEELELGRILRRGAAFSFVLYLCLALLPNGWLALPLCLFAGFAVSMLWPGLVSMAAGRFPLAGASMFALLAAAGDGGAGLLPWLAGWLADWVGQRGGESLGLRAALVLGAFAPLVLWLTLRVTSKRAETPK